MNNTSKCSRCQKWFIGLRSRGRYDKSRTYHDLLEGKFAVKVHRIDRHNDNNTIFGRHADFAWTTIDELIRKGREEASSQIP